MVRKFLVLLALCLLGAIRKAAGRPGPLNLI